MFHGMDNTGIPSTPLCRLFIGTITYKLAKNKSVPFESNIILFDVDVKCIPYIHCFLTFFMTCLYI